MLGPGVSARPRQTNAIAKFNARASVKSAEGQSQAKKINADADATVLRTVGDAEAAKTQAVGGTSELQPFRLRAGKLVARSAPDAGV
jgi:regulator of protease activity HflC (stomatin/prohibitin superfamily)